MKSLLREFIKKLPIAETENTHLLMGTPSYLKKKVLWTKWIISKNYRG